MCGRFVVSLPDLAELVEQFGVEIDQSGVWTPRFNVAPTDLAPVITNDPQRTLTQMRFGLMPFWAKPKKEGSKQGPANMINARVETISAKPAYKKALAQRRCVIPVSGYYEWKKIGNHKQPVYIHAQDGKMIPLSGVWERWRTRDGELVESFAIITREAAGFLREVHDRMPLELPKDALELWLDPEPKTAEQLAPVLQASSGADHLVMHPVSKLVNSVGNDAPELIAEVVPEPPPQLELFAAQPAKKPR
jgi:putative SOS response-associated peptidase YedK